MSPPSQKVASTATPKSAAKAPPLIPYTIPRDSDYSDLVIECENAKYNVHRVIVCAGSSVLAAALKKDSFKEAATGVFKITEFDAKTVDRMIDYMYTGRYNCSESGDGTDQLAKYLCDHVRVCAIADFFNIDGLRSAAVKSISNILDSDWHAEPFVKFLQLSYDMLADGDVHHHAVVSASSYVDKLCHRKDYQDLDLPGSYHAKLLELTSWKAALELTFAHTALRDTKRLLERANHGVDPFLVSSFTCKKAQCKKEYPRDGLTLACNLNDDCEAKLKCKNCGDLYNCPETPAKGQ